MRYVYASDVSDIAYGSFLIEESLSSFLSCMFFTRLYQTVQLYMYKTPVLIELITYNQFCYLSKSISPRQILRLLERRFLYCADLDLDLNFMHMFARL